jgi:hypothetical protein
VGIAWKESWERGVLEDRHGSLIALVFLLFVLIRLSL